MLISQLATALVVSAFLISVWASSKEIQSTHFILWLSAESGDKTIAAHLSEGKIQDWVWFCPCWSFGNHTLRCCRRQLKVLGAKKDELLAQSTGPCNILHKHRVPPSLWQSLWAVTTDQLAQQRNADTVAAATLLQYWLSMNVKKDSMFCKFGLWCRWLQLLFWCEHQNLFW